MVTCLIVNRYLDGKSFELKKPLRTLAIKAIRYQSKCFFNKR